MDVNSLVDKYFDELIENLTTLVSYNSVEGSPEAGAPFGKEPAACLEAALKMCDKYGFKTKNLDGYAGYAEMGEGDQLIGVVGHLDVVPAGEGWNTDPFKATIIGDKIYGRGVSDDKGAVVCSMIAMKIIKDLGIEMNKRVRLIMGCNEETGSKCLKYYVEKEGHIDAGFTPDGEFPGVHGEKGMAGGYFESKATNIIDIHGGVAANVVCNHCTAVVAKNSYSRRNLENYFNNANLEYTISEEGDNVILDVRGTAAHASTPELGVNAISHLLVALKKSGFQDPFVDFYCSHLGLETDGNMLGCKLSDEYGALTLNNGVIGMEDGVIRGTIDIRFPVTMCAKQVMGAMANHLEDEGGKVVIVRTHEPLYFPVDSPLVSSLLKAYQEVTGDYETQPMTMGGGTYAKGINNCIAFGCG
ncbi:MAG: Sapep family Mn(2+)-dependent dipeptidase, partial [Erysipelotrichaceae bacterium]|nr:Sapep family Mn(2+)-dependent dipeptidase [Erysipelotrichaceae bacterium]